MPKLGVSKENEIRFGAARFADLIYLALSDKKLLKKNVAHTRLGGIHQGAMGSVGDVSWLAAGMCVVTRPSERLVVVSGDGQVLTYVGGKQTIEKISGAIELRNVRTIDGHAYACGMGRQVFVRAKEKGWTAMHASPAKGNAVAGFEDLAGFSKSDLYAVGWDGEIWRHHRNAWAQTGQPVKTILTNVCCGDDRVYACGQNGALVCGSSTEWTVLKTRGVSEDLTALSWFDGVLYVASLRGLYRLEGTTLAPVAFGKQAPSSTGRLTQAQGVLWSIGHDSVASFNGKAWRRHE